MGNLLQAAARAARAKRSNASVCAFEYRLSENISLLRQQLLAGEYQPSAYQTFYVHEPKKRLISAAPFVDRVVHHALCQVIEPRFERLFSPRSFANRQGKGTHAAIAACRKGCARYQYALRLDVQRHFQSIDHEILCGVLFKQINESDIRQLIQRIMDSSYDSACAPILLGDDLLDIARPRGLPIGNLTSQFWSNCYLHGLDQTLDRQSGCPLWLRYVDDLVMFSDDKKQLWHIKQCLSEKLVQLRQLFHQGSGQVMQTADGVPWLGTVISSRQCKLKARKVRYSTNRLKQHGQSTRAGEMTYAQLSLRVQGWRNYSEICETAPGLAKQVFGLAFR